MTLLKGCDPSSLRCPLVYFYGPKVTPTLASGSFDFRRENQTVVVSCCSWLLSRPDPDVGEKMEKMLFVDEKTCFILITNIQSNNNGRGFWQLE